MVFNNVYNTINELALMFVYQTCGKEILLNFLNIIPREHINDVIVKCKNLIFINFTALLESNNYLSNKNEFRTIERYHHIISILNIYLFILNNNIHNGDDILYNIYVCYYKLINRETNIIIPPENFSINFNRSGTSIDSIYYYGQNIDLTDDDMTLFKEYIFNMSLKLYNNYIMFIGYIYYNLHLYDFLNLYNNITIDNINNCYYNKLSNIYTDDNLSSINNFQNELILLFNSELQNYLNNNFNNDTRILRIKLKLEEIKIRHSNVTILPIYFIHNTIDDINLNKDTYIQNSINNNEQIFLSTRINTLVLENSSNISNNWSDDHDFGVVEDDDDDDYDYGIDDDSPVHSRHQSLSSSNRSNIYYNSPLKNLYNSANKTHSRSLHNKDTLKKEHIDLIKKNYSVCNNFYEGMKNNTFKNKLTKKCKSALFDIEKNTCEPTTNISNRLDIYKNFLIYKYVINTVSCQIKDVDKNDDLLRLFEYYKINDKCLKSVLKQYKITFKDQIGQDVGGLTKQFFTNVSKQLKKYFEPFDEGSNRYVFKKNLDPIQAKFIGELLAFFIINNITINFNISYLYLGRILYNYKLKTSKKKKDTGSKTLDKALSKIDKPNIYMNDFDLILYYYLDCSEDDKKILLNIIKNIENIDKEKLKSGDDQFYDFYIELLDKTKKKYNFDGDIMKAFLEGFYIDKIYLKNKDIGEIRVVDLNNILSLTEIDYKKIEQYIFKDNIDKNIKQKYKHIYGFFRFLILKLNNAKYIEYNDSFIRSSNSDDTSLCLRYRNKKDFISTLLIFWTGSINVQNDTSYRIKIVEYDRFSLPVAHTCFNTLDIHHSTNSVQSLYNQFLTVFINSTSYDFSLA